MPDEIVKQLNTDILEATTGFLVQSANINKHAVEKVNRYLPELEEKTRHLIVITVSQLWHL